MKYLVVFCVSTFVMSGCVTEPLTKEEVMKAYLEALAECDVESLLKHSSKAISRQWENSRTQNECKPYETQVIDIHCETEGKWTSCCCEEEIQGAAHFNGTIRSRYLLVQEEGEWKVDMIYKESDLGRRGINICD